MSSRVSVLCRMVTINLKTSLVRRLFSEYGLSPEVLGIDLLNIFKSPLTADLYLQSLIVDVEEMYRCTSVGYLLEDVNAELQLLLNEVCRHIGSIRIKDSRLINILLQDNDTLILEYFKK